MLKGKKAVLREKKVVDAWDDYAWETDPELAKLDAAPVLRMGYEDFLEEYTTELFLYYASGRRFAIDTLEGDHIGNCSYYNYDEGRKQTELGIMIGVREYWNGGYGTDAMNTMLKYLFTHTKIDRVYLKTLNWNERAQASFTKCGFKKYGEMKRGKYDFFLMQIFRNEWEAMQKDTPPAESK